MHTQEIWLWRTVGFDYRTSTGLGGNRDTWRAQIKPCVNRTQGKGAVIHRRLKQTCLCMSEGLLQSRGPAVACYEDRGTDMSSPGSHALASVLLEVRSIRTMEPVDYRSGPPQANKPTGRDHWNYEPCIPCRSTQEGWVIVESSEKTCSTGEGNGKAFHYSCLKNPTNNMKRQKDMPPEDEPPLSKVSNILLGESKEISPERLKRLSQRRKQCSVADVSGGKRKV